MPVPLTPLYNLKHITSCLISLHCCSSVPRSAGAGGREADQRRGWRPVPPCSIRKCLISLQCCHHVRMVTDGDDWVQVLTGGKLISSEVGGQFYAPTVLAGVAPGMRIWKEEVFGPVMVIVKCSSDDEAVRLANDCPFGLGSAVFSCSAARARSIGTRLEVSCTVCIPFCAAHRRMAQPGFLGPLSARTCKISLLK